MTDTPDTPHVPDGPDRAETPSTAGSAGIDQRLRSAFHAEVDGVRPERDSLDAIRRRGRAARRRRAGVLAGVRYNARKRGAR